MNYQEALRFLDSLINYERKPPRYFKRREVTLARVQKLATIIGNPQRSLAAVHIAGTKGKGSTAAMVEAVLRAHGFRTGLYTSPHLVDVRERIQLAGRMIPKALFGRLVGVLAPEIEKRRRDDERRATYFETLTHIAFIAFRDEAVDAAVVEVGMGGRLDATNILEPRVCGITAIGLDHIQQLGNSIAAIAGEKAGIIKPRVPLAAAPAARQAEQVISRLATERAAPLYLYGRDFRLQADSGGEFGIDLGFCGRRYDGLRLPLIGRHQRLNAALALALCELFAGRPLDADAVRSGLASVRWPGRIQKVSDEPLLYIDGAHNRQSMQALFEALAAEHPGMPVIVAFGCAADKDIAGMLAVVRQRAEHAAFTRSNSPRACLPDELAAAYGGGEVCSNVAAALAWLRDKAAALGGAGVLTGSLYIAGEALELLGLPTAEEALSP